LALNWLLNCCEQVEEVFAESYDDKDQNEAMDTQPQVPEEDFSVKVRQLCFTHFI